MVVVTLLLLSLTLFARAQCESQVIPSGPTTFCQGGSVTLTSSPGINYLWNTGETTQSVIVSSSGSYSVTVTDANGCSATSSPAIVTVNPLPVISVIPSGPTTFCQGVSVTLTSSPGINYLWNTGETTQSVIVSSSGSYSVTVTDANGCLVASVPTIITVTPTVGLPVFTAGATSICQDASDEVYTATATTSTGITYSVSPLAAGTINALTGVMNWDAAFSGTATITATAAGCNGPRTASRIVTVTPTAGTPVFTAGVTTVCQDAPNTTYTATAANTTGITYSVSPLGAGTINAATGTMNWDAAFSGTATITASAAGCNGPATASRIVTVTPTVGLPSFIGGATSVCQDAPDEVYTVTATSATAITYSVSPSGAGTINSSTGVMNWNAAFSGTATITASAAGCNGPRTASRNVTVTPPVGSPAFTTGSTILCQDAAEEAYTASAANASAITYSVSPPAAGIIDASTGLMNWDAAFSGSATITASAAGCNGPRTVSRIVTVTPTVGIPAFTTGATTLCQDAANTTYTATATSTTGITYSVSPSSAGTINASNGVMNWNAAFSGTVTITASASGCNGPGNASRTVIVTPTVGIPAFSTGATTLCQDAADEVYTATAANATAITYSVSPSGAGTINASTGLMNWNAAFSGTATITASAAGCNGPRTNTLSVMVNPLPTVASITGPTSICMGTTATMGNTTSGGVWSSSNSAIATIGNTGVVTGISAGTVTIFYSVTNFNGCTRTVSRALTVNSTIVTITPAGPTTFCRGESVTLTASGANTYTWSPEGGLSITTGPTVIATPEATTTYNVTGSAATGCTSTTGITVMVNQRPEGIMSSDPAVCSGANSGTVSLTIADGSTVIGWESSINGGTTWSPYTPSLSQYATAYENLTQTTVFRALLQLNGCQGYSSIGIIPVNNVLEPVVTASSTISCLNTAVELHASGYGQPPFPVEDFQNANPAGWSGDDAAANNEDPNSNWALTNNGKTFNGRPYNSQAAPTNSKFLIVTGLTDEADHNATLTAPPFSLVGTINPILSFYTALNFNAGTTGIVEISTDGGITFTRLITFTGPREYGNPNNGWINVTYSLVSYVNQPDVRIRFNYSGTAGSNWGLDNIGIISTFQPIAYQWTPLDHMTPSTGDTPDVTIIPDVGWHQYCVASTTAAGCTSDTVCVTINVLPLPVCDITGADGPVCPSSTNTFIATEGMASYAWSITGNGTITAGATARNATVTSGNGCNLPFTLTLTVTDNNGCNSTCTKTVLVQDITPPSIICPAVNAQYRMNEGLNYYSPAGTELDAMATDNCTLTSITHNLTYHVSTTLAGYHFPLGSTTVTWTALDACGLTSTCQIIIIVIDDQPPAITCPPPVTVACAENVPVPFAGYAAFVAAGGVATDNNQIVPALFRMIGSEVITNQTCAHRYTIARTYQITDLSGNSEMCTHIITVDDQTAPVINGCPENQIFCDTRDKLFTIPATITATDNCSGIINITYSITGATERTGSGIDASGLFNIGNSIITWTFTDSCGNTSACSTTITINPLPATSPIYHR